LNFFGRRLPLIGLRKDDFVEKPVSVSIRRIFRELQRHFECGASLLINGVMRKASHTSAEHRGLTGAGPLRAAVRRHRLPNVTTA
jgi:hypothetical protein